MKQTDADIEYKRALKQRSQALRALNNTYPFMPLPALQPYLDAYSEADSLVAFWRAVRNGKITLG